MKWSSAVLFLVNVLAIVQGAVLDEHVKSRHLSNSGRVIGGDPVDDIKNRNFQVAIFMDGEYFCGGSLIGEDVVLTAAHCTYGRTVFEIQLGSLELGNPLESVTTTNKIEHEDYNPDTHINDIALLKLEDKLDLTSYDGNIAIINPPDTEISLIATLVISGWGLTANDPPTLASLLQQANIVGSQDDDCKPKLEYPKGQFCVNNAPEQPCIGDSGGPLTFKKPIGADVFQVGIASYMTIADCGNPDVSPVFTDVWFYKDWITSNL